MEKLPSPASLVPAVITALNQLGGKAHFNEIEKLVAKNLSIDPTLLALVRTGKRTEFAYRMSWARTAAKKQGIIRNEGKGIWSVV